MSQGCYKIRNQYALHYWTMTVVGWVDVFTRKEYKEIVLENLSFYKKKGLNISAYVIMSNHIHLIGYAQENAIGPQDVRSHIAKKKTLSLVP